jgi:hypothetical protein
MTAADQLVDVIGTRRDAVETDHAITNAMQRLSRAYNLARCNTATADDLARDLGDILVEVDGELKVVDLDTMVEMHRGSPVDKQYRQNVKSVVDETPKIAVKAVAELNLN